MKMVEVRIPVVTRFKDKTPISSMYVVNEQKEPTLVFEDIKGPEHKDKVQMSMRFDNNDRPFVVWLDIKDLESVLNALG